MNFQTYRIPNQEFLSLNQALVDYNHGSLPAHLFSYNLSIKNIQQAIHQREQFNFRSELVEVLREQSQGFPTHKSQSKNTDLLEKEHTFTIATAHQSNLFGGPLYFIQKAVSAIKACKIAKEHYPNYDFVPIYWLGSEDHDFEELNFTYFNENKIEWKDKQGGAFGRYNTSTLLPLVEELSALLGFSTYADELKQLIKQAYLEHNTIAESTRFLLHQLLGKYGLIVIDGDDKVLKSKMISVFERELTEHFSQPIIQHTSKEIEQMYGKSQAHPREINLFYLKDNIRNRIIRKEENYLVYKTSLSFSKEEIIKELHQFPERFSPNVILRPIMQEIVLPNLMYVGGGGELSYWLQLKGLFDELNCPFPLLGLRDTAVYSTQKVKKKLGQLNLSYADCARPKQELIKQIVEEKMDQSIDLSEQKDVVYQLLKKITEQARTIDSTLQASVEAELTKMLKSIRKLEKKFFRAEKRKHQLELNRLEAILTHLFPKGTLQERRWNFTVLYKEYGEGWIDWMMNEFNVFEQQVKVMEEA